MRALVHVWTDYLCPYCYLELPVLEAAARQFGAQMKVQWHAFELRPEPIPLPDPDGEYIAEHWQNRVLPMAVERGLPIRLPRRSVRSRRALLAALYARSMGAFAEFDRALFRARFVDDADIADLDILKGLASGAGLEPGALATAVDSSAHADDLHADMQLAEALGIGGVPTMLIGPEHETDEEFFAGAEPVVGAVPQVWLDEAITRALSADRAHANLRRRFRARWKAGD